MSEKKYNLLRFKLVLLGLSVLCGTLVTQCDKPRGRSSELAFQNSYQQSVRQVTEQSRQLSNVHTLYPRMPLAAKQQELFELGNYTDLNQALINFNRLNEPTINLYVVGLNHIVDSKGQDCYFRDLFGGLIRFGERTDNFVGPLSWGELISSNLPDDRWMCLHSINSHNGNSNSDRDITGSSHVKVNETITVLHIEQTSANPPDTILEVLSSLAAKIHTRSAKLGRFQEALEVQQKTNLSEANWVLGYFPKTRSDSGDMSKDTALLICGPNYSKPAHLSVCDVQQMYVYCEMVIDTKAPVQTVPRIEILPWHEVCDRLRLMNELK